MPVHRTSAIRSLATFAAGLSLALATPVAAQTDAGNDFVSGDRVLYSASFGTVTVGMFPRSLRLLEGNA